MRASRKGGWLRVVEAVHQAWAGHSRVGVGLSGGADSVVLAEALYRVGARPVIIHFNHRWRGRTSEADARWVKAWAARRKLRIMTGRAARPGRTGEGEAREERWKFFAKVMRGQRLVELWLAHQADDQAETVLMQLLRGAGPEGLAGMGPVAERGSFRVVRPLLPFCRTAIRQAAREAHLEWRDDNTNHDEKGWRVRVRKRALPFLTKLYGRDVRGALARTAEILGGEADYWRQEIGSIPRHPDTKVWRKKPVAWQRRAIRAWLGQQGYDGTNFAEVEGIRSLIGGGSTARWQLRRGGGVQRSGGKLFYVKKMGLIAKGIYQ